MPERSLPAVLFPLHCRQLVGSFIQTQKYSMHKALERRFRNYLTRGTDFHHLLLSLLRGLLRDEQRAALLLGTHPEEYVVPIRCAPALVTREACLMCLALAACSPKLPCS
jgi:hypothetical protein